MTTATLVAGNRMLDTETERPRRSLEELVDQLFAAMGFTDEPEAQAAPQTPVVEPHTPVVAPHTPVVEPQTTVVEPGAARSIHEARRLRQAGDVDGALGVLGDIDAATAAPRETRWAFSEWKGLVRRRFGGRGALVYSQGTGRAAALVPTGDGGALEVVAALGMRWRPGKVVSERSLRGLRPLAGGA